MDEIRCMDDYQLKQTVLESALFCLGGGRVGESTGLDNLETTSSSSILIGSFTVVQVQILDHTS